MLRPLPICSSGSDDDVKGSAPRAGIIGTGFIGGVHAHAVHAAGYQLSRVAASSPARARAAADRLACHASPDATELIESDDVDVVHICTPNATHLDLAERALEAGKHVVCEKPLATTKAEAQRLSNAARAAGVVAAVPFIYRYYPTVREARARIADGEAGPLWLLHGSYLQDWLSKAEETNWRVNPTEGGGSRAFGDIGVHWCDLMEFTTGHRITRLSARLARAFPERGASGAAAHVTTEDGALLLFETDRGASGSVVVSQVSPGRKNRLAFSFDGPRASYVFDQETPDSLWVGGRKSSTIINRGPDTLSSIDAQRYARLPAGHPQGYQDSFNSFVDDVYATVAGDARDGLPTFADGLRAAGLTEAVLESSKHGTWVEVPA